MHAIGSRRLSLLAVAALISCFMANGFAAVRSTADFLDRSGLSKAASASQALALKDLVSQCRPGDALVISGKYALDKIDLSGLADDIEISGEGADTLYFGGVHRHLTILNTGAMIQTGGDGALGKTGASGALMSDAFVIGARRRHPGEAAVPPPMRVTLPALRALPSLVCLGGQNTGHSPGALHLP